ncbi:MAG: NADH-quinone oxidoreductase subunit M [Planctomycetota bacterium]|jgi:NADH-quinone oxidoreductase subunit M
MLLTLVTFIPGVVGLLLFALPSKNKGLIKWIAMAAAVVTFIISCVLLTGYHDQGEDKARAVFDREVVAIVDDQVTDEAVRSKMRAAIALIKADYGKDGGDGRGPASYAAKVDLSLEDKAIAHSWREVWELTMAQGALVAEHINYVEYGTWIGSFNIHYFMGADGLSLPLVWLTSLLSILCLGYSWNIEKATKAYFGLFLLLQCGITGVFLALDFFLFYVFWEVVLLPMYFLIGFWGGPRRIYAAIKFFIYTLAGSVLMLIAMLAMYFHSGYDTFNVLTLMEAANTFSWDFQFWLFLGMFVAFAIKVPIFPFHTWLPDAHVQAPTAASVILAGVLLKMGGYGFFRFSFTLCPNVGTGEIAMPIFGNFINFIAVLGVINIVYGAFCALAQKDFKSLVAYSSVSHMGFVLLGLAAMTDAGVQGAALQMFNHGLSSAMMFLIVGVIYERAHHRNLDKFGGIGAQMPYYTGIATVGFFASLGLPGLNGFISEALVFMGAYEAETNSVAGMSRMFVYLAAPGIVLTAAYILWTVQRVFMGDMKSESYKKFPDLNFREVFALAPLGILCIVFGVWPRLILDFMNGSLSTIVQVVKAAAGS